MTAPLVASSDGDLMGAMFFLKNACHSPKMSQGTTKRSRTQQHVAAQAEPDLPGREQLLFTSPEL
jgi:hypothetical protein